MGLSKLITRLRPSKRRAENAGKARAALKSNAEKALRLKQAAEDGKNIPEQRTAHEGMHNEAAMMDMAREASFTPQLKRSKVSRSGDAS